ncbi:MAG: acetyl-CoA hydrolase/transferase family protein [Bacteroidetes bacterium]|nr:acetyl-CoA hydrolase/transferase family protein [Bacteroidota bacterium]
MIKYQTAAEAVKLINSGDRVFFHGAAATPQVLIDALVTRHEELKEVEIIHIHTEGDAVYAQSAYEHAFHVNSFFVGANIRNFVGHSNVQYIPIFLSEIPALFRRGRMPLDAAFIQVSPPDQHGFCSLGVSVDVAKAASDVAKKVIALVNPNMPRSHGDGQIHSSRFSAMVHTDKPIYEFPQSDVSENELAIGKNIASLVENGSTLQLGIGGIPGAVMNYLHQHKDLGLHTEMFTDAVLPLIESGVINGRRKRNHPGKVVSTFAMGTKKLYDFIHDNPMVAMLDAAYVNDTAVIRKNPKVVAINSAIQIDLSGQVCADSIGSTIYSGVGGQMDFIRGASLSEGGKPIIALSSVTGKGVSKIVPLLNQGAGVVTTRAHVHYVVTEFGIADLYGKNIAERAKALIAIAHPDRKEELEKSAFELYGRL